MVLVLVLALVLVLPLVLLVLVLLVGAHCGPSACVQVRACGDALVKVCQLFVLQSLSTWLDWFVATKYMTASQMFLVKAQVLRLCEDTRKVAVPLVDAFGE